MFQMIINKSKFKCLGCQKYETYQSLGKFTGLNKHIRANCLNQSFKEWYKNYQNHVNTKQKLKLSQEMLILLKYFISSNTSLSDLENPYLRELLKPRLEMPGYFSFRETLLPN